MWVCRMAGGALIGCPIHHDGLTSAWVGSALPNAEAKPQGEGLNCLRLLATRAQSTCSFAS
jgi:hypothetical protein